MDNISQVLANDELSCQDTSMNESLKLVKKSINSRKKKRFAILSILFIVVLASIGAVTFKYLGKRTLECS